MYGMSFSSKKEETVVNYGTTVTANDAFITHLVSAKQGICKKNMADKLLINIYLSRFKTIFLNHDENVYFILLQLRKERPHY